LNDLACNTGEEADCIYPEDNFDCDGNCIAEIDCSGECGGGDLSCLDCAGVPNGDAVEDECGVCNGDGIADDVCDCSGTLPQTWYNDADGDGLGDPNESQVACEQPLGYIDNAFDIYPDCESNIVDCDDTCDGTSVATNWYTDLDDDGLGDPNSIPVNGCADDVSDDLVDNNDDLYPDCTSNEVDCNGDCDGTAEIDCADECGGTAVVDECDVCNGSGQTNWYNDADGDGLGDPNDSQVACEQPLGYIDNAFDIYPDCESNIVDCNGDCDGTSVPTNWYWDADGDNLGFDCTNTTAVAMMITLSL